MSMSTELARELGCAVVDWNRRNRIGTLVEYRHDSHHAAPVFVACRTIDRARLASERGAAVVWLSPVDDKAGSFLADLKKCRAVEPKPEPTPTPWRR